MRRIRFMMFIIACLALAGADKAAEKGKAQRHDISIVDLQFKPVTLKIKAGDTVAWTNNDDRDHTVVAKDGTFKSENLKSGQAYEFTFSKSGKFPYVCTYHPRMKGEVDVD